MSRTPEAPVLLVEYDPAWPAAFERERGAYTDAKGAFIAQVLTQA